MSKGSTLKAFYQGKKVPCAKCGTPVTKQEVTKIQQGNVICEKCVSET